MFVFWRWNFRAGLILIFPGEFSGSLPCNVNVPGSYDRQFFEEARRKKSTPKQEYTAIDMEEQSLLEHDALNQDYSEAMEVEVTQTIIPAMPKNYTTSASLQISEYCRYSFCFRLFMPFLSYRLIPLFSPLLCSSKRILNFFL